MLPTVPPRDTDDPGATKAAVEARYRGLRGGRWSVLAGGLIHRTHRVDAPAGRFVVQEVSPIFDPVVHEDIEAVTAHLARKGIVTPRLLAADDGARWIEAGGRVIRVLTFVEGRAIERVTDPAVARAAGAALGAFHAALSDLDHEFRSVRVAHDPARHVGALVVAVDAHAGHRLHDEVARLAEAIAAEAAGLPDVGGQPRRIVHGDPKITNLLFDPAVPGRPVAWVDLDTCGRQVLAYEFGDAVRSWTNPAGEEGADARVDPDLFRGAVAGYASAVQDLAPEEREGLVVGVEIIALELASRFATDALEESYFGWDPARHPASGEHQLARARGQWALYRAARAGRAVRERIVRDLLG
ncbi:MAG: aminoglycoside phosphotransferase family protein [Deltaproteobacteria bacterium]|nr:MAG: aminoglycoside phosphotransferase family protein [Deltaproteobacteria bacterium]